ncbi:MAG: ComF family protein [Woeseiaceae bacterium]|nr:ComF family protein [Woeseiaceae bacterium]
MLQAAASGWSVLGRALWPPRCAFCGQQQLHPVCAPCRDDLPWLEPRFDLEPFAVAIAPLAYAFPVDAAIRRFKFHRRLAYGPAFAHLLRQAAGLLPDDIDAVLAVPLHWRRQARRGFNQAAEIARPICRRTGLPQLTGVSRSRSTPYQSGLSAGRRRQNLRNAFRLRGAADYRHVLVIDDVITTGETCRQVAKVLLEAGVPAVSALAIARVAQD